MRSSIPEDLAVCGLGPSFAEGGSRIAADLVEVRISHDGSYCYKVIVDGRDCTLEPTSLKVALASLARALERRNEVDAERLARSADRLGRKRQFAMVVGDMKSDSAFATWDVTEEDLNEMSADGWRFVQASFEGTSLRAVLMDREVSEDLSEDCDRSRKVPTPDEAPLSVESDASKP